MKYTWPTPEDPTPPIFHGLALGFRVGENANLGFRVRVCVGSKIPTCWYPQRQILASGALPNAKPQRQVFCVAVQYRLYSEFQHLFAVW